MASKAVQEAMEEEIKLELTPMIDISFLIIIFFMCLPFKTLEGKLAAFLPTDKGLNPTPQPPPDDFKVQIHIVPRKFKKTKWGPKGVDNVEMPTEVRYRYNEREGDLDDVGKWIAAGKDSATQAGKDIVGEIKAGHRVPHKYIIAVLNKFADQQLEKVDFYGTKVPPEALRKMQRLPYPTKDYGTTE